MSSQSASRPAAVDGFHTTHKLKQMLLLLQQLPGNSDRIPLVLGPAASGKTALLCQLCRKAPARWRLSRIDGSPDINGRGLVLQLARDWMPERSVDKRSDLMAGLADLRQRGLLPVVVVDDAERLPQEALRLLLQLRQAAGTASFHPILLADMTQRDALQRLLSGQAFQLLYLSPWTAEEVTAYVKLATGKPPSRRQLDQLQRRTGGWAGRLVGLLDDPSVLHPSRFNLLLGLALLLLVLASLLLARWPLPLALVRSASSPPAAPVDAIDMLEDATGDASGQSLTLGLPEREEAPSLPAPPPPATAAPPLRDGAWLHRQDDRLYSLQLGQFWRRDELERFAAKHRLDADQPLAALRLSQGQGYLLVYGLYPDHRAAVRARLLVPDSLHPDQVEVRRIRTLKREITKE